MFFFNEILFFLTEVQGHRQTRQGCCMFRLRDAHIQTQSDNTRALI